MYVSIILPFYNAEKDIIRCIESILSQSYVNFELVAVNDGASDSSPSILNTYLKKDKRIRLINKENGGVSSARNAGIKVSNGDYICFVDSDDWLDENYLQVFYDKLKKCDSDLIITQIKSVYSNKQVLSDEYVITELVSESFTPNDLFIGELFIPTNSPTNKLFKSSIH